MNHNEEMKLLTAVQKLQKNTERIAIALEKLVKQNEETQVVTVLDPGFPDGCNGDACDIVFDDECAVKIDNNGHSCQTCRYHPDHTAEACVYCVMGRCWEPKEVE